MKIRKMKFPLTLVLVFMLFFQLGTSSILASQISSQSNVQESNSSTEDVGFTVVPQLPQNQINSGVSYFDLMMTPGDEQVLQVELINTSNKDITVSVDTISASTNRNGIIDYTTPNIKDESLIVAFSEIAAPESEQITIPKNSSKMSDIKVTMPKQLYDGSVLGGLIFRKVSNQKEINDSLTSSQENNTAGATIDNIYSYVVGVKLTETDTKVSPNFEIDSIDPTAINYQKAIFANIRNTQPLIIKGMDVNVEITKENSNEVLLENSLKNIDMAPNSVLPFPVLLDDVKMSPGKYIANIHIELNDQEWDFEEPFEIDANATIMWEENTIKPSSSMPFWAIILITVGALVLLGIIILIILLLKRGKKENFNNDL